MYRGAAVLCHRNCTESIYHPLSCLFYSTFASTRLTRLGISFRSAISDLILLYIPSQAMFSGSSFCLYLIPFFFSLVCFYVTKKF